MRKFEKIFFLFLEINFIFAAPLSEREVPYSFDGMKPSWETMAESRKDMMDRTLKVTHKLYSRVVVQYDEYQRALLLIDNAAVKVAFEYFDDDGNGVVTKNEMMKFTETELAKKEFNTDIIGSNDFMLIYLSRYWHFIDQDNNGSLDYYEFRKFVTDWMNIPIQRMFDFYDYDKNEIIEGSELAQAKLDDAALFLWHDRKVTAEQAVEKHRIWTDCNSDGRMNSLTKIELLHMHIQFLHYLMETNYPI